MRTLHSVLSNVAPLLLNRVPSIVKYSIKCIFLSLLGNVNQTFPSKIPRTKRDLSDDEGEYSLRRRWPGARVWVYYAVIATANPVLYMCASPRRRVDVLVIKFYYRGAARTVRRRPSRRCAVIRQSAAWLLAPLCLLETRKNHWSSSRRDPKRGNFHRNDWKSNPNCNWITIVKHHKTLKEMNLKLNSSVILDSCNRGRLSKSLWLVARLPLFIQILA